MATLVATLMVAPDYFPVRLATEANTKCEQNLFVWLMARVSILTTGLESAGHELSPQSHIAE